MKNYIDSFKGKYEFLSNFYPVKVTYMGFTFDSSEAAYQAAKCPERTGEFVGVTPAYAKSLGKRVELRKDWEDIKDRIMYEVCDAKFRQNPDIKLKLIATGDDELVEGNFHGDRYWGVYRGVGNNRLGETLMELRTVYRNEILDQEDCE